METVLNNEGEIVNEIIYDAFDNIESETDSNIEFRFGYTGRELDEEIGLQYYRARYYDGEMGRFISQDPIGFEAGDTNLYRYVNNSSLNYTDPYGEDLYDVLNGVDKFLAGFADATSFGLST